MHIFLTWTYFDINSVILFYVPGFESLSSQPPGPPQNPAQSYANPQYGYGAPAGAPYHPPAQSYNAPPQQNYAPATMAGQAPLYSQPQSGTQGNKDFY